MNRGDFCPDKYFCRIVGFDRGKTEETGGCYKENDLIFSLENAIIQYDIMA